VKSNETRIVYAQLDSLRPTQMTVGRLLVQQKRRQWRRFSARKRKLLLKDHWFPAVLGPNEQIYIIDHHHLGLALAEEGISSVSVVVLQDYDWLDIPTFWNIMEYRKWVHPYDELGVRRDFAEIPEYLSGLTDDVYRSVADSVQRNGGFAKDTEPYSEFLWADYFRAAIKLNIATNKFKLAVKRGVRIASEQNARYLPGWTGEFAK